MRACCKQAALIKTKNLRSKDRELMSTRKVNSNDMELEEKVAWMQQIIDEEQGKPLQVSKDFVLQYEDVENKRKEKLDNEIFRHVENLKRIRKRMDKELDLRRRHQDFRKWKVERAPIKKAIMEGKVVTAGSLASSQASDTGSVHQSSVYTQQTGLETVLQSLNKLEQLEQRIATLERNKAASTYRDQLFPASGSNLPSHAWFHCQSKLPLMQERQALSRQRSSLQNAAWIRLLANRPEQCTRFACTRA